MRWNKWTTIWTALAVGALVLLVVGRLMVRHARLYLNFEFWTPLPSVLVLLGFFGLFSMLALWTMTTERIWKAGYVLVAVVSLFLLGFMAMWGMQGVDTIRLDTTTVHVSEYRFLFAGSDTFYKQENLFVSRPIGSFCQDEDCWTEYRFEGDVLTAIETWYNGHTVETEIDFAAE